MAVTAHVSHLAYFKESTAGTPPADASAWASTGTLIRHRNDSIDPSTLKRTMIRDTRSRSLVFDQYDEIKGLRNCEFSLALPLSGSDAETADTSQVALTKLMTLLQSCMGGLNRTTSTTCTGGTATAPTLAATTGVDEGVFLAFEDQDEPNVLHVRRVTALSSSTVTLDEALPFTPANGDPAHGVAAVYVDESVLLDSVAASETYSWLLKLGGPGAGGVNFELIGASHELTSITLGRDNLMWAEIKAYACRFKDASEAPDPNFASNSVFGLAPVPVGPSTHIFLQDYGTTTAASQKVNEFSLEPGIPRSRVETVTTAASGMDGTATYSFGPGDTKLTLNLVPNVATPWTNFNAGTYKVCRFATQRAPGQNVGLHFSRCEVIEDPASATAGDIRSSRVVLRARPDLDNSNASSAALWKTKAAILLF